jgi:hypothetical protein
MGISLHDGVLTSGIHNDKPVSRHPDTGMEISGIKIPNWHDIMLTGARAQFFSNLSYAGVDMVVDKFGNVKVLEVNRRPGLSIQLANKAGLKSRLEFVNNMIANNNGPEVTNNTESIKGRVEFAISMDRKGWNNGGDKQ